MSTEASFYRKDLTFEALATKRVPAHTVVQKGVLHFKFKGKVLVENSPGLEFDGPATDQHIKDYAAEYKAFMDAEIAAQTKEAEIETEMQAAPVSFEDKLGGLING